jgi:hypothetical protein
LKKTFFHRRAGWFASELKRKVGKRDDETINVKIE